MAKVVNVKLDQWIQHGQNVLFTGKHGVGKTAMVKEAFDRHKLNWLYFSTSTMDPWVDFVGVPKEKTENPIPKDFEIVKELAGIDPNIAVEWLEQNWKLSKVSASRVLEHITNRKEGLTYLDLIRPQSLARGNVEALFFDEYNRSPKKVRNAVMELIQFKSINGLKFPNLKVVWAAINPEDDEQNAYEVEKIDPAQKDRFHVNIGIEYKPSVEWFRARYGKKVADSAIQWWTALEDEQKNLVSPRRLQYALDFLQVKGDIRDILTPSCNVPKLLHAINSGPILETLEKLMQDKDAVLSRNFLSNENNYAAALVYIKQSTTMMKYFLPLMSNEKISNLMAEEDAILNFVLSECHSVPTFASVAKDITKANLNQRLIKRIKRYATENPNAAKALAGL